eukprot:6757730-Pyramimonas_sp.AAC.1
MLAAGGDHAVRSWAARDRCPAGFAVDEAIRCQELSEVKEVPQGGKKGGGGIGGRDDEGFPDLCYVPPSPS